MKIKIPFIIAFVISSFILVAQEAETTVDKPVRSPFESQYIIDNQTTVIMPQKTLGLAIQHKFGDFTNGKSDIWGIYSSANIRIAFDYVPFKNVQIGYGLTRTNLTHDFNLKWTILEQTRKNSIPIALAVYGNVGISGDADAAYGQNYSFKGRLSSFGQLIIGRKFNDRISLQIAGSFAHFNMVDTSTYDYDRISLHLNGRVKVTPQGSIIFNVDYPLEALRLTTTERNNIENRPNVSFGYEISTSTHAFQIFCGYSKEILAQQIVMRNQNDFVFEQFRLGFIITRLWGF